jgi:hypothetical protein
MLTRVTDNTNKSWIDTLTSTTDEVRGYQVADLPQDLKRILRVQIKELIHLVDEVQGHPFAEAHAKLAYYGQSGFTQQVSFN